jgi:LacI family transcriptional regulator
MKKITIAKIAELAEVSQATVSRVLNGYVHVRPEIRERVQRIIAETGFQPHHVARLLASNHSNMIGLVIPSGPQTVFIDPYFLALTEGISKATNQHKQTLALFIFHSLQEGHDTIQSIINTGMLDGLVMTADMKDGTLIPQLIAAEMPFVLIGRMEGLDEIHYVDADNLEGGYMATKHLLDLGYTRIGTICSGENKSGDDRFQGYRRAMQEAGIELDMNLVYFGDYSLNSAYNGMKKLLPECPEAMFVSSDTMSLGAIKAIREAGLTVPDDIAIVGYDDLPPALQAEPPLTTIQQPIYETGRIAVEILLEVISNPRQQPIQTILPNKLIVRASCGALQRGNQPQ